MGNWSHAKGPKFHWWKTRQKETIKTNFILYISVHVVLPATEIFEKYLNMIYNGQKTSEQKAWLNAIENNAWLCPFKTMI